MCKNAHITWQVTTNVVGVRDVLAGALKRHGGCGHNNTQCIHKPAVAAAEEDMHAGDLQTTNQLSAIKHPLRISERDILATSYRR